MMCSGFRFVSKRWIQHAAKRLATVGLVAPFITTGYAETLHRLTAAEIRQQFTGKVLTDGTHWKETYGVGGKFTGGEMGHDAVVGTWRIDGDRLCKSLPDLQNACYEVWGAGNRMELRYGQATAQQGFLRPASAR